MFKYFHALFLNVFNRKYVSNEITILYSQKVLTQLVKTVKGITLVTVHVKSIS